MRHIQTKQGTCRFFLLLLFSNLLNLHTLYELFRFSGHFRTVPSRQILSLLPITFLLTLGSHDSFRNTQTPTHCGYMHSSLANETHRFSGEGKDVFLLKCGNQAEIKRAGRFLPALLCSPCWRELVNSPSRGPVAVGVAACCHRCLLRWIPRYLRSQ
jgi:hypothetical protein